MGQNATIHAKDDAVQDSLGRDTWQPLKSTSGALHVTSATNEVSTPASAVTTVSDAAAVQLPSGVKSWQAIVTGTGAVTATVQIQFSNDGTNWMSHADYTLTLSGTTSDVDAFTEEDAYAYHRASVTAISGTGAAVTVTVGA